MFYKGRLHVRFDWNQISALIYPTEDWDNSIDFPHIQIAHVAYGTQPSIFSPKLFNGTPEGYQSSSGNFIKFERATDDQILELLNFWNDSPIVAGTVSEWVSKVEKQCHDLLQSEKERLARLGKQSKYW